MSTAGHTEKLKRIHDALISSQHMDPYRIFYRVDTVLDMPDPYIDLFLERESNTETTLGRGVPHPRTTILQMVVRAVAPGHNYLTACETRDAMVDAVRQALDEQKAGSAFDLDGLSFGDVTFDDFSREQGGFASVAQISLSWLIVT